MKAKRPPIGVTPDLQDLTRRNRDRRTPAEIERILIGHDRAQGIVAPAEVHHDETSAPGTLGKRDVVQECRSRKADGERRDAVTNEFTTRKFGHRCLR